MEVVEDGEEVVDGVTLEDVVIELYLIENLRLTLLLASPIVFLDLLHESSNEASYGHADKNGHFSKGHTLSHVFSHFLYRPAHLHLLFFEGSHL